MKTKHLKCNNCHYEGEANTMSYEEAEKRNIILKHPQCPRCGSYDIILYDYR